MFKNCIEKFIVTLILISANFTAEAKWEKVHDLAATYACYVTKSGNILLSDYQFNDRSGGIYISEDSGQTWIKTEVEDYCYSLFYEAGDYIFAGGEGCKLARSADEGKTWEIMDFSSVYSDYLSEDELMYNPCYAIAYHKERLYVGDLNGGGIAYSEDFGETWTLTDRNSLMYELSDKATVAKDKPTKVVESFYNMLSFNDDLYAFGVYFIFRFNEDTGVWDVVRNDSNFMGVTTIFNDTLVCGRAIMNYTDQVAFLETTKDGNNWGEIKRPEGLLDNNVRTLASDTQNIYVGLQQGGMYYTPDFGESWANISEGLPCDQNGTYYTLLTLTATDEYLYVVVYDNPWNGDKISGLYRMKKSDLPTNSVADVIGEDKRAYVEGNNLIVGEGFDYIDVLTIQGFSQRFDVVAGRADVSRLPKGVYIYSYGRKNVGKFIKK